MLLDVRGSRKDCQNLVRSRKARLRTRPLMCYELAADSVQISRKYMALEPSGCGVEDNERRCLAEL
jgi:hypothetical protein